MRKSTGKLLAMTLSLAMVIVGTNIPGNQASAAKKVKLTPKKATLYIGGPSSRKKVTLHMTAGKKTVKAIFTSNKKKIATVSKKTGKVTA